MHKLEKPCKILILINSILSIIGYVTFIQTQYQLTSPLIPKSIVYEISSTPIIVSLVTAVFLFISLCFYFLNKRMITIILCSISILSYYFLPYLIN